MHLQDDLLYLFPVHGSQTFEIFFIPIGTTDLPLLERTALEAFAAPAMIDRI